MPVALDDLGAHRVRRGARGRRAPPPRGPAAGGCTCRPGPLILPVATSSAAAARRSRPRATSNAQPAHLSPNVVGSAWTEWVRPIITVPASLRARAISARTSASASVAQPLPGGAELEREPRVDDVAAREPEVEVAPLGADRLGDLAHERDHVVVRGLLDLGDPVHVDPARGSRSPRARRRDQTPARPARGRRRARRRASARSGPGRSRSRPSRGACSAGSSRRPRGRGRGASRGDVAASLGALEGHGVRRPARRARGPSRGPDPRPRPPARGRRSSRSRPGRRRRPSPSGRRARRGPPSSRPSIGSPRAGRPGSRPPRARSPRSRRRGPGAAAGRRRGGRRARREQQRGQRRVEAGQDRLGLGVAEPDVGLEQDRARGEHEAGVEEAAERVPRRAISARIGRWTASSDASTAASSRSGSGE